MTISVLYQIYPKVDQSELNTISSDLNGFNCLQIDASPEKLLLFDVLYAISHHETLVGCVDESVQYYAQYQKRMIHLPSPSSYIPVANNGVAILKLFPGVSPLVAKNQLPLFQNRFKQHFPSSSAPYTEEVRSRDRNATYKAATDYGDQHVNPVHSHSTSSTYGVGDFSEAAEVAKDAAQKFFSFAATVGKSMVDVAHNFAHSTINTSVAPGGLSPGTIMTISRVKVQIVRLLSEGGFGMVYVVKNEQGINCALKQLLCQSKEQVEEAHREIDALQLCKTSPYFIQLLDHSSTLLGSDKTSTRQVLLLFPLYPRGTAWEAMERSGNDQDSSISRSVPWPFPEPKAISVLYCMASALDFLHDHGFAHRDVKPHNVLLSEEESHDQPPAVLMDLGSITPARVSVQSRQEALRLEDEAASKTSAPYRSPELTSPPLPPFEIDERVDTWGLGCTMYCLAFGRSPFETPKEGVSRLAIMNGKYSIPPDRQHRNCRYSDAYINLMQSMLQVNLQDRPFMKDILTTLEQFTH